MVMLLDGLAALKGLVKVKKDSADIDGSVFKLHYRITSSILFLLCLIVTCNSLLGDPIHCSHGNSQYLQDALVNTFCWIHGTFTLPRYLHGNGLLYDGIGQQFEDDEVIHHAYYQWVPFVLFIQSIMFYVPHWIWKCWEGGKVTSLTAGLSPVIMPSADRKEKIGLLCDYICNSIHSHNVYAVKFFICEVLNFLNAIMNMWFLNRFLGGSFMSYGIDVVNFSEKDQLDRTDPMIVVFPRVTKCTFYMFGPSGSVETHDLMCVLALNVINEKIFLFLWFWLIMLSTLTCVSFLYRLLVFFVPSVRNGLLQKRAQLRYKITLDSLAPKLYFGDYFLLYLISKNLEIISFTALLEELSLEMRNTRKPEPEPDQEMFNIRARMRTGGHVKEKLHLLNEKMT